MGFWREVQNFTTYFLNFGEILLNYYRNIVIVLISQMFGWGIPFGEGAIVTLIYGSYGLGYF